VTALSGAAVLGLDNSADAGKSTATVDTVNVMGALHTQLTGLAPAAIQYKLGSSGNTTIKTGSGGGSVTFLANLAPTTLIGKPTVPNALIGSNAANTWKVLGPDTGTLTSSAIAAPVTFTGYQSLNGSGNTDVFIFSQGQGVSGAINGNGGGDWLDYSAYTTAIAVNLTTGLATGVGGG